MKLLKVFFFFTIMALCVNCSSSAPKTELIVNSTSTPNLEPPIIPTQTIAKPAVTETPFPTPIFLNQICSPLQGETLASLPEIITQPFRMPPLGFDYDHQGVDFSYYRRNGRIGIQGLEVHSALNGKVIAVLRQKMVYGNAIIIETPIDQIPDKWVAGLGLPAVSPTVVPNPRLPCPDVKDDNNNHLNPSKRSLYLLYAHMEEPLVLKIGDSVLCGQKIGLVGNSGKSTNPHLHVEVRIGPSGAVFEGMAHYDASSTELERHNYCVWRVSNLFQLTDPMNLFKLK
jgi:murein DD-endopeptidase MepM/ murein hydrolase activator NlpD